MKSVLKIVFALVFASVVFFCAGLFLHSRSRAEYENQHQCFPVCESDIVRELSTNRVVTMVFSPNFNYIDSGDTNFVVDFSVEYCQASTNFFDYGFARVQENSSFDGLRICFLDSSGNQLLSVPCVNRGEDVVWDMEGSRIVQLCGSFIFSRERCEYMKGRVSKLYIEDRRGNLLGGDGKTIVYGLSDSDVNNLIIFPLSRIEGVDVQ